MLPSWLVGTFACRAVRLYSNSRQNLKDCSKKAMGTTCGKSSNIMDNENNFDVIVCNQQDLEDGKPQEFKVEPSSVLLVKNKGQIHAVSHQCTHYGASLVKGSFNAVSGQIRCPWHGACFNVANGDIEDFPGLNSLQCFNVKVDDEGQVHVTGQRSQLSKKKIVPMPEKTEILDNRVVVIVGGGAVAQVCAETLRKRRENPWHGKIIMLTQEKSLPYDRPKLSKAMTSTGSDLQLRGSDFYSDLNIDTKLECKYIIIPKLSSCAI